MAVELKSSTWEKAGEQLRKSRLSTLTEGTDGEECWEEVFDLFQWKEMRASEFKFRKVNALEALKRYDEAEAITAKYLGPDLICDKETDTFFMAAYRLFEMTDNKDAKRRVEKKMPITIASLGRHCKRKI